MVSALGQTHRRLKRTNEKLLVIALLLTRSHIVDDGIAPDVILCLRFGNPETGFAYNDSYLSLVVERICEIRVKEDLFLIGDD